MRFPITASTSKGLVILDLTFPFFLKVRLLLTTRETLMQRTNKARLRSDANFDYQKINPHRPVDYLFYYYLLYGPGGLKFYIFIYKL